MRELEAKRLVQSGVKYGETEHKANVFVNGANEIEKAKFVREYPALVETYRREARSIELPIGRNRNMTIAGKLARRDPKLHAIVSRGDELIRVWNEQESERLRAAKAQAEAELKRLEPA